MSEEQKFYVGSRKSELALIQTRHVISLLTKLYPDIKFEIVTMTTMGDRIIDIPLPKIGEKSLFTKELETALADGTVDFIVHSLKDLPTSLPSGMVIGAVLTREDPRDALVLHKDIEKHTLTTLPKGSVIGTSSLRRTAQLAKKYPHLKIENIRGNLNTRLKKLDDLGQYQAIILASAGLIRIGWKDRISKQLDATEFLYAVGQGAIAVECRAKDEKVIKLLEPLYDLPTALRVIAERSFLKTLGGGCSAPVAVTSDLKLMKEKEVEVSLRGAVWSLNGKEEIIDEEKVVLQVLNNIKCAECPYVNGSSEIKDIECCVSCPMNKSPTEPKQKKLKLDVPSEVLAIDPHEKCPISMPIGSDFMGECPFLHGDVQYLTNVIPINSSKQDILQLGAKVCPVLHNLQNGHIVENGKKDQEKDDEDDLFAGLVPHKDATLENIKKTKQLGERLAYKLIEKGASTVMAAAQSYIHNQTATISVKI